MWFATTTFKGGAAIEIVVDGVTETKIITNVTETFNALQTLFSSMISSLGIDIEEVKQNITKEMTDYFNEQIKFLKECVQEKATLLVLNKISDGYKQINDYYNKKQQILQTQPSEFLIDSTEDMKQGVKKAAVGFVQKTKEVILTQKEQMYNKIYAKMSNIMDNVDRYMEEGIKKIEKQLDDMIKSIIKKLQNYAREISNLLVRFDNIKSYIEKLINMISGDKQSGDKQSGDKQTKYHKILDAMKNIEQKLSIFEIEYITTQLTLLKESLMQLVRGMVTYITPCVDIIKTKIKEGTIDFRDISELKTTIEEQATRGLETLKATFKEYGGDKLKEHIQKVILKGGISSIIGLLRGGSLEDSRGELHGGSGQEEDMFKNLDEIIDKFKSINTNFEDDEYFNETIAELIHSNNIDASKSTHGGAGFFQSVADTATSVVTTVSGFMNGVVKEGDSEYLYGGPCVYQVIIDEIERPQRHLAYRYFKIKYDKQQFISIIENGNRLFKEFSEKANKDSIEELVSQEKRLTDTHTQALNDLKYKLISDVAEKGLAGDNLQSGLEFIGIDQTWAKGLSGGVKMIAGLYVPYHHNKKELEDQYEKQKLHKKVYLL